jgi:hypothetical protein
MEHKDAPITDDIMDYANGYIIYPGVKGNLARFISGINKKKGKRKQNLKAIKVNIQNKIHVLLVSIKPIKEGTTLCYDYDENGLGEYRTDGFK